MPAPDVDLRRIGWSALALAATVAAAIGTAAGLVHVWHIPAGGPPSGAMPLLGALRAQGPALQSAPQAPAQRDGAGPASGVPR